MIVKQHFHARMPWVLPETAWRVWLDPETPQEVITGILNAPETAFDSYPISHRDNNPRNEGPELITRIPQDNS